MVGARYEGEPVPRPAPDLSDDLIESSPVTGAASVGTGALDIPIPSMPYNRPTFGVGLTVAPQDLAIGVEIPQASAGRPFIRPGLSVGVQGGTPEPDRRRIARPMPTAARDETEVIR
jgi:hypothetical protein